MLIDNFQDNVETIISSSITSEQITFITDIEEFAMAS